MESRLVRNDPVNTPRGEHPERTGELELRVDDEGGATDLARRSSHRGHHRKDARSRLRAPGLAEHQCVTRQYLAGDLAHRWRGTDTGRASMLRQTAFSLSAPRRYLGRGTRRKLRAEVGTVIRRGLEGSGAGTAKRRNGAGGCAARRRAHHGASAGFMASRTPCEGLPGPARACTGTEGVRSVRSCQRKRLKATGCGGLRVVQGRCPWSRLTRDNYRYRESNDQFQRFRPAARSPAVTTPRILGRAAMQFNPLVRRVFLPPRGPAPRRSRRPRPDPARTPGGRIDSR